MQEIEVKILGIKPEAIRQKLNALGAHHHFSGELHALFFDYPDARIKEKGDVLRLRKEGDEIILAYKKQVSKEGTKIMEEHETAISNFEEIQEILAYLGVKAVKSNRKFREEYVLKNSKIVIDDYKDDMGHIPPFIEIESPSEGELYELAALLGFRREDCKSWDTRDLVHYYVDLSK
jgi:adenylate cyclase class 2